jgi:hypothetical protein
MWSRTPVQGEAWISMRKSLPKSHDGTYDDFINSPKWQEYMSAHRTEGMFFYLQVDDRKRFGIRSYLHKDGHTSVTVGVPAEMFLGDESKQDVCRDVVIRTYTWASEKFGWPPPPPLPLLTVKRTYRKNYRPPGD